MIEEVSCTAAMAAYWLSRCLLIGVVLLCIMGGLPSCVSAMGGQIPKPPPDLNFTIGVEGVVWCMGCRYSGYNKSMDASPLPSTSSIWQIS